MGASIKNALLTWLAWAALSSGAWAERLEAESPMPPSTSQAGERGQQESGPLRLYAGGRFGVGGDLAYDLKGGPTVAENLQTSVGFQGGVDYVVMRYFGVGGELRFGWFNTDELAAAGSARSRLIDIVIKPSARYAFRSVPLELYAAVPFGLTLPHFDDAAIETKAGWTLGFGAGITGFFTEHVGVNLEVVGLLYYFRTDLPSPVGAFETDARLGQFTLFANLVYAR